MQDYCTLYTIHSIYSIYSIRNDNDNIHDNSQGIWLRMSCTCCGRTNVCPNPTQCMASNRVNPNLVSGKL